MKHLQRFERSMLAGAVVAVLAAVLSLSRHKEMAAQAAATHESLAHLMVAGVIAVAGIVGLGVFVITSIAARHRRRSRSSGRNGRSGNRHQSRARYGGEW